MNEKMAMVFNIPGAAGAITSSIEVTLWQWAYTLERRRNEHAEHIARAARDVHASPMEYAARGEGSPDYSAAVWMTCHTCAGTGYVLPATDEVMEMAKEADDAG